MDTSDPNISFDHDGVCNHCHTYDYLVKMRIPNEIKREKKLNKIVTDIKMKSKNKDYDCIIGVSGGVDSSYLAYITKNLGLRPLAIHLDNGWNSELGVKNIQLLLNKLEIDLETIVLDWEEFKSLQLAFLKASTPDSEIPTDHAIIAVLNQKAMEIGVKYIIYGTNLRTESHMPVEWSQGHLDWRYINSVNKLFGLKPLVTFPHFSLLQGFSYYITLKWFPILNYIDYNKTKAIKILEDEFGWKYYGGKHYESIYTRFFQGYILPKKFGYDKRRAHFSSLVCSGEITRDQAISELTKNAYPPDLMDSDYSFLLSKFGLSKESFEEIFDAAPKTFHDYPSYDKMFGFSLLKLVKQFFIK